MFNDFFLTSGKLQKSSQDDKGNLVSFGMYGHMLPKVKSIGIERFIIIKNG